MACFAHSKHTIGLTISVNRNYLQRVSALKIRTNNSKPLG